jgi:hypothetical protein
MSVVRGSLSVDFVLGGIISLLTEYFKAAYIHRLYSGYLLGWDVYQANRIRTGLRRFYRFEDFLCK